MDENRMRWINIHNLNQWFEWNCNMTSHKLFFLKKGVFFFGVDCRLSKKCTFQTSNPNTSPQMKWHKTVTRLPTYHSTFSYPQMNDKQSNHFYLANLPQTPTASSEALFPQIHFSFSAFAPAIYAHSPINPTFIPNKFPNLLPYPQVSFKSLLPTLGLNSPDCTVLGLPFRTPLLLRYSPSHNLGGLVFNSLWMLQSHHPWVQIRVFFKEKKFKFWFFKLG